MNYRGYLLKESLKDTSVLEELMITEKETFPCPQHMKAEYMDDVWTGIVFIGKADDVNNISERLSKLIRPIGWYIDIHTETENYLVFPKKVFSYKRIGEEQPWPNEAIEFAKKCKIPAFVEDETACSV
ncbi:MAG: hypothetical protein GY756_26280 [bacterium]|nr:hypothetical protein [bacterium]